MDRFIADFMQLVSREKYHPLVSIILPTHNRSQELIKAIESVERQQYNNYQLLIIDDHSSEDIYSILRKVPDRTKLKLNYVRLKNQGGVACARNVGIQYSKGEYIAFLDSDDIWLPNNLEDWHNTLTSRGYPDVVFSKGYISSSNQQRLDPLGDARTFNTSCKAAKVKSLFLGNFIALQGLIIAKKSFERVGLFDTSLYSASDYDFAIRVVNSCETQYKDSARFVIHTSGTSITNNLYLRAVSLLNILNKNRRILRRWCVNYKEYLFYCYSYIKGLVRALEYDSNIRENAYPRTLAETAKVIYYIKNSM